MLKCDECLNYDICDVKSEPDCPITNLNFEKMKEIERKARWCFTCKNARLKLGRKPECIKGMDCKPNEDFFPTTRNCVGYEA